MNKCSNYWVIFATMVQMAAVKATKKTTTATTGMLLALAAAWQAGIISFMRESMISDAYGMVEVKEIIIAVIAIVVGALLVSSMLPTGLNQLQSNRNTSWASGTLSSYDAISIMAAISGMLIFVAVVVKLVS